MAALAFAAALAWCPAASATSSTCSYSSADHALTVTNTDVVRLTIGAPLGGTEILLAGGPFAPGATPEADGSSEIEFELVGDNAYGDVLGTPGRDVLTWGPGGGINLNFDQNGDRDVDVVATGAGVLFADGGRGPDLIEPQTDFTPRASGDPVISDGSAGNDVLIAPATGAFLVGGKGRDTLMGNGAFDFLMGGPGHDRIIAGGGSDHIELIDGTKDRASCGPGRDRVKADRVDRLRGCEQVIHPPS